MVAEAVTKSQASQKFSAAFLRGKKVAIIGYIRVSTVEQNSGMQRDALTLAGAEKVFEDQGVSGSIAVRPGLDAALEYLRAGDTLAVWRLDRLSRNTRHTLDFLHNLSESGIGFRSLTDGIDTSGPVGSVFTHAMLTILAAFAELERSTIQARTVAGLQAARDRGSVLGRPRALDIDGVKAAAALRDAGLTAKQISDQLHVSPATIYRALQGAR